MSDDKLYRVENTMWTALDVVERCIQRVELLEKRVHNLEARILREDIRKIADEIKTRNQPRLVKGRR
jgi:folate-dependent phosphoribosylglycinamide formyltransferase PurN